VWDWQKKTSKIGRIRSREKGLEAKVVELSMGTAVGT
jgi:hypothetical protein